MNWSSSLGYLILRPTQMLFHSILPFTMDILLLQVGIIGNTNTILSVALHLLALRLLIGKHILDDFICTMQVNVDWNCKACIMTLLLVAPPNPSTSIQVTIEPLQDGTRLLPVNNSDDEHVMRDDGTQIAPHPQLQPTLVGQWNLDRRSDEQRNLGPAQVMPQDNSSGVLVSFTNGFSLNLLPHFPSV